MIESIFAFTSVSEQAGKSTLCRLCSEYLVTVKNKCTLVVEIKLSQSGRFNYPIRWKKNSDKTFGSLVIDLAQKDVRVEEYICSTLINDKLRVLPARSPQPMPKESLERLKCYRANAGLGMWILKCFKEVLKYADKKFKVVMVDFSSEDANMVNPPLLKEILRRKGFVFAVTTLDLGDLVDTLKYVKNELLDNEDRLQNMDNIGIIINKTPTPKRIQSMCNEAIFADRENCSTNLSNLIKSVNEQDFEVFFENLQISKSPSVANYRQDISSLKIDTMKNLRKWSVPELPDFEFINFPNVPSESSWWEMVRQKTDDEADVNTLAIQIKEQIKGIMSISQ